VIFWLAVSVIIIGLGIFLGLPIKIPREPDREGAQDGGATKSYDEVSRWFIFDMERSAVLHKLRKCRLHGLLIDLGCGPGHLAAQISRDYTDLNIVGLDNNRGMLLLSLKNWSNSSYRNVEFVCGDVHNLPFVDNSVEYVVSSLSLHHWTDGGMACREIFRILKPGGQFIIFDLNRNCPRFFYYILQIGQLIAPKPIRRTNGAIGSLWASYTPYELREILYRIPWEKVHIETQVGWMIVRGYKPD